MSNAQGNVARTRATDQVPRRFNWRVWWILLAGIAVGQIGIVPYSLTLQTPTLEKTPLPVPLWLLIPLQIAQGLVLYGLLAGVGLWLAGRIGLGLPVIEGWLRGESVRKRIQGFLLPALLLGVGAAVAILLLDQFAFGPPLQTELNRLGIQLPPTIVPPAWQGFLASFYGGIVEEVLLRLFVLTLLAWIGSRISRTAEGRPTLAVLWTANVLSAVLFGLGHLPATQAAGLPLDALVVTRAIVLNGLAGLAFGWLYWTYGLESAMLSHWAVDIVLHVVIPLVTRGRS